MMARLGGPSSFPGDDVDYRGRRLPPSAQTPIIHAMNSVNASGNAWLLVLLVGIVLVGPSAAREPGIAVSVDGAVQVLFDPRDSACDPVEIPDAPAIAFRDDQERIVLFAPSFRNRAFVGRTLGELQLDCRPRFQAANSPEPNLLDDRLWLHAVYTTDGRTVFALGSVGYMPYRHGRACAAGPDRTDCWYNGIAVLRSGDAGASFAYDAAPPRHLLLKPPQAYSEREEHPEGFITATNLVRVGEHVYTLVKRRRAAASGHGMCVLRARVADLTRWETWDGRAFVAAASRQPDGWLSAAGGCADVGGSRRLASRGLVYHAGSRTFVTVFEDRRGAGLADQGFYYRTSTDLLQWSDAKLLYATRLQSSASADEDYGQYPSIIDGHSADRNFGHVGDAASLVFVRLLPAKNPSGKPLRRRQLVAVPLTIR